MSQERIAIIGSNCFTGAHFAAHCMEEGASVLAVSRSPEPAEFFLPYRQIDGDFHFRQLDLNHQLDEIMHQLDEFQPEYIVNFAAQGMVGQSWQAPQDWFQTNTTANVALHDRLRKTRYLKKYTHISTPEVYGNCSGTVKEHTHYRPSSPYAVSKAAADMSLDSFFRAYDFPVVFTRAANVYGPCQQLYRIIPRTIIYFLTDKTLSLHGGGTAIRSFIHIWDVVRATLEITRHAPPGEIYHLSTSRSVSIRELVEMIAGQLGVDFDERVEIVGDRLGKDSAYRLDSSKIQKQFGWKAEIELEKGIDETIEWVKRNLDEIETQPLNYIHKK